MHAMQIHSKKCRPASHRVSSTRQRAVASIHAVRTLWRAYAMYNFLLISNQSRDTSWHVGCIKMVSRRAERRMLLKERRRSGRNHEKQDLDSNTRFVSGTGDHCL